MSLSKNYKYLAVCYNKMYGELWTKCGHIVNELMTPIEKKENMTGIDPVVTKCMSTFLSFFVCLH